MEGEASRKPDFGLLGRFLSALTFAIARFPKLTLLLLTASCVVSLGWTAAVLKFKTDRADLIDPSADFHQRWLRYTERFGETPDILVVVEAESRGKILSTLDALGAALEAEPDLFTRVQWRTDPAKLRAKGLQYLPPAILEFGLRQLDVFEPILEGHWERVELGSYAESLARQIESALGQKNDARLQDALIRARQLVDSLQGFSASPTDFQSPWPEIIPASAGQGLADLQKPQYQLSDSGTMGFLLVSPRIRDQDFAGGSASIARLREIVREFNGRDEAIDVGLTGIPILEADEMARSQEDMTLASILSSVIVLAIMLLGFGGLRHPLISMVMLGVGVCWSLWFATVVVGHLNILSMTFASILIGLGVDYAIHYLEHYLELRHEGLDLVPALARTAGSVGSGILTCAVATAMSFFCAALTSFQGVKELGIIAGGGVLLCVVAAFLSLPALVVLADRNVEPGRLPRPFSGVRLQRWVATAPWLMGLTAAAVVVGGGCLGFQIQDGRIGSRVVYDSNLLNMQVADAPSVVLQHRVFEQSQGSLLYGVSIADTPQEARRRKAAFEALPSVGRVVELASALPESPASRVVPLVSEFQSRLQRIPAELPSGSMNPMPMVAGLGRLAGALSSVSRNEALSAGAMLRGLLEGLRTAPPEHLGRLLIGYQEGMRIALHTQFRMLLDVADPQPVSLYDLPESLRSRFVSRHGEWALQVYPAHQVWDEEPLSEFVRDVRSVDPEITGTPLQNYEAARQIRDSYYDAAVFATAMIVLVLLVDFLPRGTLAIALLTPVAVVAFAAWTGASRGTPLEPKVLAAIYATVAFFVGAVFDGSSVFKTFCALLPPVAGGFMTFGIMGLTGMNLNPANMIVLPLLLGMGVDAGIYVVHDYREQTIGTGKAGRYRMSTCTINSIIMISTTTVVGFGCMLISAHRGIVSLGLTLTIGVTCSMLVSLIFLPSLLTVLDRWNARYSLADDVPPRPAESLATGDVAFEGRSTVPVLTRS